MRQWIKTILGLAGLIVLDQLTKLWALGALKGKNPIAIRPEVLELHYVENRGAAFGIMQNRQWFFLLITVVVLAVLIWLVPKIPEDRHYLGFRMCLYFIGAGAIGNMIDRMFRKYVVDFIYFRLIDFPVFTVADIYVTVSAIVFLVLVLFYYKEDDYAFLSRKKNC